MKRTLLTPATAAAAAMLFALGACEAQKSANPLSPNIAGPIAGVSITAPAPVAPANGAEVVNTTPVRLVFNNATSNSVRPFWYVVELASDPGFTSKLYSNAKVPPADGAQTTVVVDGTLAAERTYYWHVKAADGANESTFSDVAQFELVIPVVIGAPSPVSPVNGQALTTNTPTLVVNNGPVQGRAGTVEYRFYVARNNIFSDLVAEIPAVRSNGSTTSVQTAPLPMNTLLYWMVIASNGKVTAQPSAAGSFRTPPLPSPGPSPGPTPPPAPGAPCVSGAPLSIVECERSKYGHMSTGDLVNFLRATARSLNSNGISGGPFGILRKGSGHNCNGYSCDVLCAGQGNSQRQWDVLGDADGAQTPDWSGPHTVPGIRVDVCEIQ